MRDSSCSLHSTLPLRASVVDGKLTSGVFFFNDTATTEIYTLSLHDALPIARFLLDGAVSRAAPGPFPFGTLADRKSTRLNSSHRTSSYAALCLNTRNHW